MTMQTATVTRGQIGIAPILQVCTPGLLLQTACHGAGARPCAGFRRVRLATDVVEYLFYKQLDKVLGHKTAECCSTGNISESCAPKHFTRS